MKVRIKRRRVEAGKNIKVTESDGRTLISAPDGGGGGGGGGYTEGAASDVVGSDGKLLKAVRHSTYAAPSAYPTELRAVNTGRTVRLDSGGLSVEGLAADFLHDPVAGTGGFYTGSRKFEFDMSTVPGFDFVVDSSGLTITDASSGKYVLIDPDAITQNMSIQTIDVCDSGTPKQMLVLGSAPF